jgi:hypothetical protein
LRKKLVAFFWHCNLGATARSTLAMSFSFPLCNRQCLSAIVLLVSGFLLPAPNSASAQIVFSQNFSGGTNVSDYVGSGANRFDAISSSDSTNMAWSITSGALQGIRSANNAGTVTRTTDLATSLGAIYRFDINVVDITQTATSTLAFYVGSGFNMLNSAPTLTDVHSRFSINFTDAAANSFIFRDIGGSTNGPTTFTGTASVFFVVNNTGSTFTYTAPNNAPQTVANDKWDLWVNATQQFNEIAAQTPTVSPTDFKLLYGLNDGRGTIQLDNFSIVAIPEPGTWVAGALGLGTVGFMRVRRRARVNS